jgi:hypothetical protein
MVETRMRSSGVVAEAMTAAGVAGAIPPRISSCVIFSRLCITM